MDRARLRTVDQLLLGPIAVVDEQHASGRLQRRRHRRPERVEPLERYVGQPEAEEHAVIQTIGSPVEDVGLHEPNPLIGDLRPHDREHLRRGVNCGQTRRSGEQRLGPGSRPACQLEDVAGDAELLDRGRQLCRGGFQRRLANLGNRGLAIRRRHGAVVGELLSQQRLEPVAGCRPGCPDLRHRSGERRPFGMPAYTAARVPGIREERPRPAPLARHGHARPFEPVRLPRAARGGADRDDRRARQRVGGDHTHGGFVLAHVDLDYHREVRKDHEEVDVVLRLAHVGTSSVVLEHEVRLPDGAVAASGKSVLVAWDLAARAKRVLTEHERAALTAWTTRRPSSNCTRNSARRHERSGADPR